MKRYGYLYDDVCSFEALLAAAHKARKGKRYRPGCREFFLGLEPNLIRLSRQLKERTYRPGRYRSFLIHDGKTRLISAAPFRDRVVHHALVAVLEPLFERTFIFDSYANRKGKGTHKAVDRFTAFSRKRKYVLKCDVRQFFPCVDHAVLKSLIARKIKDPDVLWLIDVILAGWKHLAGGPVYYAGDNLFTPFERARGLPIGNLTSQFWANVYLNPLDHFVKESLRCRHYIRYMDDFVLFSGDKAQLWQWRQDIIGFLEAFRISLHEKKAQVSPVACGTDFLGYLVFPDHRRLRRDNVIRFRRRMAGLSCEYTKGRHRAEDISARLNSWLAHASHADTYGLRRKMTEGLTFSRKGQAA